MHWVELSVESPPEFVESLSQVFMQYGHGGVAIDEDGGGYSPDEGETPPVADRVIVKTYMPLDSSTDDRYHRIDVSVRLIAQIGELSALHVRVVDEEEWQRAWKEHFYVLRIGKRTVIVPSWRDYEANESDVVIGLDPGMAFGTGHHPTTRMCLELLEEFVRPGVDVMDVGCGSGILSIAAAKLGAGSVFLTGY